jgi:hypothetical protein
MEKVKREENSKIQDGKCLIGGYKNKDYVFLKASSFKS